MEPQRRPSDSFLRSNKKRNALYAAAEGRCQHCGKELGEVWHANHVEPWIVTGRTNVYEMEALCPSCNTRKGDKMPEYAQPEYKNIRFDKLRIGQRGAVETLIPRVEKYVRGIVEEKYDEQGRSYKDTHQHTALILPYGYGKSDIIRVAGVLLSSLGLTGANLILEPASYLVKQITDAREMEVKAAFYNLPRRKELLEPWRVESPFKYPTLNRRGIGFFGMTIQMVWENIETIFDWVNAHRHKRGCPPMVFIDEAHSASVSNTWGKCIKVLTEAGAVICLLTATPFRSDEEEIEGFHYVDERATRARVSRPLSAGGDVFIDLHEDKDIIKKLMPDFEYTLYEAWREEPSVICTIDRLSFDLDLGKLSSADTIKYKETKMVSALTPSEVVENLADILRQPEAIKVAVETMMPEFIGMRRLLPEAKSLIYSTNDPPFTPLEERNAHAYDIKAEIERQYPGQFNVKVATSTLAEEDGDADAIIEDFKNPRGADILIVKQMGGTGLDIPAIKTVMDLSPTRAMVSWSQRIMRGDRVVDPIGDGSAIIDKFDYITPDDCISVELFEKLIKGEGGDTRQRIRSPIQPQEEGQGEDGGVAEREQEFWAVLGGAPLPPMKDSWGYEAPGEAKEFVDETYAEIAELRGWSRGTRPIISKIGDIAVARVLGSNPATIVAPQPEPTTPTAPALGQQEREMALRKEANTIMSRIVRIQRRQYPDINAGELQSGNWVEVTKERCGLAWKPLGQRDLEELEYIVEQLQEWEKELV